MVLHSSSKYPQEESKFFKKTILLFGVSKFIEPQVIVQFGGIVVVFYD